MKHFARLAVVALEPDVKFEYPRTGAAWEEVSKDLDPLVSRLDDNDRTELFRTQGPIVKLPQFFEPQDEANQPLELPGGPSSRLVEVAIMKKADVSSNWDMGDES